MAGVVKGCAVMVALGLLTAGAHAQDQSQSPVWGTWYSITGNGMMVFRFLPNGRFTQQWVNGRYIHTSLRNKSFNQLNPGDIDYYGNYRLDGEQLTFLPDRWAGRGPAGVENKSHPPKDYMGQAHTETCRIQADAMYFEGELWTKWTRRPEDEPE